MTIEFEFEVLQESNYKAVLQISDDLANTWQNTVENYDPGGLQWFSFEFPGPELLDGRYTGGQFYYDWLEIHDQDDGSLVWKNSNLGSTSDYMPDEFEGGDGGDSGYTFSSPGFEAVVILLAFPALFFTRKRR